MPNRPATLLVITGLPCTGKSALARELERTLRWPLLSKDEVKEQLFATLGWSDREWSRKMSEASYRLVFATARKLLMSGASCILEGNFRRARQPDFENLVHDIDICCMQIVCKAPGDIIVQRFLARAQSGVRHPGHVDLESFAELENELRSAAVDPVAIGGAIVEFDATDLSTPQLARFAQELCTKSLLAND